MTDSIAEQILGLTLHPSLQNSEAIHVKKLIWAALTLSFLATTSHAQESPKADLASGYSFFYIIKGFTVPMNGASGTVAVHATNWLGVVGDVGAYHNVSNDLTAATYTFGPRFYYHRARHFVPFAHALIGGTHFSAPFGQEPAAQGSHFTYGFGCGADFPLLSGGRFALRPEGDYYAVRINGSRIDNVRLAIGIVFRFGNHR